MEQSFLTVKEVATRLKCHPHTVRRWIWEQKLLAVKVGDLVRVPEGELAKLVKPIRKEGGARRKDRRSQRGAIAIVGTMRALRKKIKRDDVEEVERLIAEAGGPPDWSDPLA